MITILAYLIVLLLFLRVYNQIMNSILQKISITINDKVYLKNPESSVLGKKIISGSIDLIDELGVEDFTFRKLAVRINSTEASIYRYFENKHYLLVYLIHWYWGWMEYRLVFRMMNISDPKARLTICINLLTSEVSQDSDFAQIDEVKLNRIVISESSKVFLNKGVDEDNKVGLFKPYKTIVQRVSDIILEVNPKFKYPHMLVSTVIEGAHHQRFFAAHLPNLTDIIKGEDAVTSFYQEMLFKTIK
jgi:AcrR family transcriptional regulator